MGNYEGGDEVIIGKPSITGTKASVKSRLFMVDTRFAKATPYRAFSWVDQLKLIKNGSHWEITDMVREDGMSLTKIPESISQRKSILAFKYDKLIPL